MCYSICKEYYVTAVPVADLQEKCHDLLPREVRSKSMGHPTRDHNGLFVIGFGDLYSLLI